MTKRRLIVLAAAGVGAGASVLVATSAPTAADEVPLRRWVSKTWPNGVDFGASNGVAFCDFDHDGWIDVYSAFGRQLWRNVGGTDWALAADLAKVYPTFHEYSSAWADYDNDGLPDCGTEPRDACMSLLRNLGNATFDDVGDDTTVVDVQPCDTWSETLAIADVDGDGNLDWFLPAYPPWIANSTGNWFLHNQGPDASGKYSFVETAVAAGLDNPPAPVNRPEGAQFCDHDRDGDVDLYSNNTIYRNLSVPGTPAFEALAETGSGVVFSDVLEEGGCFLDYDMDGDLDLCLAFADTQHCARIFENLGDGTFELTRRDLFESPALGVGVGLSCADWDNDGDVDVMTRDVFRRNQWIETGARSFTIATHSVPPAHISEALTAWGDFDQDGDLDAAIGNAGDRARLYHNDLYGPATPLTEKRHVRVKVVRDSTTLDDGLETEFGAEVTVRPIGGADTHRRVGVVSTSGGYLNQNEYALHFALPPDPHPDDPDADVRFSVAVDFKGSSSQGFTRVDRRVNPVLGELDLARLEQREIVVYRSGRVRLDGCDVAPVAPARPLQTTTNGLLEPGLTSGLAALVTAPSPDWFVGIELSTARATEPLRIEEVVLDGHLDAEVDCSGEAADTWVWDVSDPANPVLAAGGRRDLTTRPRNARHFLSIDATLEPGKTYRVVCRVTDFRATPTAAPVASGPIDVMGGLAFQDSAPCTGLVAAGVAVDPAAVYLAVRFRPEPSGAWADLGHALAGTRGDPVLTGTGALHAGDATTLTLTNARASAPLFLMVGFEPDCLPLFGGVLVPSFDAIVSGFVTDAAGSWTLVDAWPAGVPGGTTFHFQALVLDPLAPRDYAFTNALAATAPY